MTGYYGNKTGTLNKFTYMQTGSSGDAPLYIRLDIDNFRKFFKKSQGAFTALDPHEFDSDSLSEWAGFFDSFKGVKKDDDYSTYINSELYNDYVYA